MVRSGLTAAEVEARRRAGLTNAVGKETSRTVGGIVLSNLFNAFNIAVFSMAILLVGLWVYAGDRRTLYDSLSISSVALLNTLIGIFQEIRAKIALDRVIALSRPTATVLREGAEVEIPAEEVVKDDVLVLRRGDQVPVDGRVLESRGCEVDESLLTGESAAVEKPVDAPLFSGSFCVAGSAVIVAERVGEEAYVHRLTREVRQYKRFATPLQRHIDRLVEILMATAVVVAFLVVAAALAKARGAPPAGPRVGLVIETTRSVTSVLTSLVPAGLILLSSVAFALGVYRISRRGALVQKLNAIESFANVDVVCMDKTGTLTRNELRLAGLTPSTGTSPADLERLVAAFAHGSSEKNATILALERSLSRPDLEVTDEIPFNSEDKFSALAVRSGGAEDRLFLGAFEVLAPRLVEEDRARARAAIDAGPGLRHLVLASLREPGPLREAWTGGAPLRLAGVVSLADEIRPDIPEVLERFASRGIALKVLSGDAPETVEAVARAAGWTGGIDRVVTGPEIDRMTPEALAAAARDFSLFARVSPQNKRDLVASLQAQGRYVAMIGDGVNDVLALKKAELGVAMGAGSRMARDVSDIVLLGNDFAILPRVLEEGTTIIANVQSAAKLFLTKNLYAVMLILFAGFVGLAFPLVPRHVTVIGFFTISVPALLIAFTRHSAETSPAFLKDVLRFTAISGGCIALAALTMYFISLVGLRMPVERARTAVLSVIVILSLLNFVLILGGTRLRESLRANPLVAIFALGFAGFYGLLLFVVTRVEALSPLAEFFEVHPLGLEEVAIAAGITAAAGAGMIFFHRAARGLRSPRPPPSRG
jgi:cation-transporting ATPase E